MPGTNLNAQFDGDTEISLTDENNLATTAEVSGNPSVVATEAGVFANGCIIRRTDIGSGGALYQNVGSSAVPSWQSISSGGGTIGGTINTNQIGFGSALNTLTSNSDLIYTPINSNFVIQSSNGSVFNYFGAAASLSTNLDVLQVDDLFGNLMMNISSDASGSLSVGFGDLAGAFNSTTFVVNDNVQTITGNANVVFLGDTSSFGNNTYIYLADNASVIDFYNEGLISFLSPVTGGDIVTIDTPNIIVKLGDITGNINKNVLKVDDNVSTLTFERNGNPWLYVDTLSTVQFGDIGGLVNSTRFELDDSTGAITATAQGGTGNFNVRTPGGFVIFKAEPGNHKVSLGDVGHAAGSLELIIDDSTGEAMLGYGLGTRIDVRPGSNNINITADSQFNVLDAAVHAWIQANPALGQVYLGDVSGTGNATRITIQDTTQTIAIEAPKIDLVGLTAYANNAAAVLGGLSTGMMYYTNVAGDGILKIVI